MSERRVRSSRVNDKRGNSTDRKNRKLWMLKVEKFGGDGVKVACVHCKALVGYGEVEADRIIPGGTYARINVQPSCSGCNKARSNNVDWKYTG